MQLLTQIEMRQNYAFCPHTHFLGQKFKKKGEFSEWKPGTFEIFPHSWVQSCAINVLTGTKEGEVEGKLLNKPVKLIQQGNLALKHTPISFITLG